MCTCACLLWWFSGKPSGVGCFSSTLQILGIDLSLDSKHLSASKPNLWPHGEFLSVESRGNVFLNKVSHTQPSLLQGGFGN